jgi:hypothetical protein
MMPPTAGDAGSDLAIMFEVPGSIPGEAGKRCIDPGARTQIHDRWVTHAQKFG